MPDWLLDIYVLVTSRVPRPRSLFLFAMVSLSSLLLIRPVGPAMSDAGIAPAALAVLLGYVAVVALNLPATLAKFERDKQAERTVLGVVLALCAGCVFAPSLIWVQHGISGLIAFYTLAFILLFMDRESRDTLPWFARDWTSGQRNAANWNVVRLVALILGNEALTRFGSGTDWVVGAALGPIAAHYLMHWTILATHPYEDEEEDRLPD